MTDASQQHERGIPAFDLVPAMPWWLKCLNAPAHPYCRAAVPTSMTPSRMNTPLASLSQIRSGTGRSVRYTQAGKAAHWEFVYTRNGITVRVLNRHNPARGTPVRSAGPRRSATGTAPASFRGRIRAGAARLAHATHTLATRGRAGGSSCRGHPASPGRGGLSSGKEPERRAVVSANGLGTLTV